MCGITAFIAFKGKCQSLRIIQSMNDLIKHRGPDDEGYYAIATTNKDLVLIGNDTPMSTLRNNLMTQDINAVLDSNIKLALGHRRLSIVDLSELGHQPLSIDDDNYWICHNGEVYNYLEIKEELESIGYRFKSKTDTEVILTAYKEWGRECLHQFNGMFAFIIYDKVKNNIFVARDRFGVKPLYFYSDDTGIYFSSEIKAFTVLPSWKARLNHQRAYDFLMHGVTDHTDETLFANVYQVKGGEYGEFCLNEEIDWIEDKQKLRLERWYDLKDHKINISYVNACKEFKDKFINSIKLRLRSDVDIGSCLSGGLDSSAIVSVMSRELKNSGSKNTVKTFSACSHYKEFDEKEYVDIVVKDSRATSFCTYPELENLFKQNEEITWHQDEPFGSTSIYAQWEVFKLAAAQKIKVMLDGQGADEQLCGYKGLYIQSYFNELFRKFKFLTLIKEMSLFHKIHAINRSDAWQQLLKLKLQWLKNMVKIIIQLLPMRFTSKVFGSKIKLWHTHNWLNNSNLCYKKVSPFAKINYADIRKISYGQLTSNNLSMLLHWEDRDSMAHSIESRVPFLDYNMVEFVYNLPTEYKISKGTTKCVLRDGLDGILPEAIKNRQTKLGFVTPEEIWVKGNSEFFREKLLEAIEYSQEVLLKEAVLKKFDMLINGDNSFDFWLWRVISFGTWMRVFKVTL